MRRFLVGIIFALMNGAAVAAVGSFLNGAGVNSRALAGAGVAFAEDGMVMSLNPALLTDLPGAGVQFGLTLLKSNQHVLASEVDQSSVPEEAFIVAPGRRDAQPDVPAEIDGVFPIPSASYHRKINETNSAGIVIYGNGGINVNYKSFENNHCPEGTPKKGYFCFGSTGSDISQLFIVPTWAHQINDKISVGVGAALIFQTLELNGFQIFSGQSVRPGRVSNNGHSNVFGGALKFGLKLDLSDQIAFGIAAQSRGYMQEHEEYSGILPDSGDLDIPPYIQLGLAFNVTEMITVITDFQRIYFSQVNAFGNPSQSSRLYGEDNGPGFGWKDAEVVKVGIHAKWSENVVLRMGYADVTHVPVGTDEILKNIVSLGIFDEQLTGGVSWSVNKTDSVDFGIHKSFRQKMKGVNPFFPDQKLEMSNEAFTVDIGWRRSF